MGRVRFWDAVGAWTLPLLVLAVGIFPPHVHAPLSGALAAAGLLLALALLGAGRLPSPRAGTAAPLLAAAVIAIASAAMALYPTRSMRMLIVWLVGGLSCAAARSLGDEGAARRAGRSVVILATILAALGLYQSLVDFPAAARPDGLADGRGVGSVSEDADATRSPDGEEGGPRPGAASAALLARLRSARAVGTLGLPALLASILILGIPLSVAEVAARSGARRAPWLAALGLQIGALAATRSVGGLAGLAAATLACAVAWAELKPALRRTLVVLVLVAAAAAIAPRLAAGEEGSASRSFWLRLANWRAAASMVVSHPILGVGPDNYAVAFPQHRTWASNETQHAHNSYLEAVADLGLPALLLIAAGLAALARAVRSASGPGDGGGERLVWRRALAVGCAAWALQAALDFTAYVAATLVPFLVVAGLLIRETSRPDRGIGAALPSAGTATRALLLAAASAAAIVAVPDAVARRHLDAAVEAISGRAFVSAVEEARSAAWWNPFDAEAHLLLSQALLDLALHLPPSDAARSSTLAEALDAAEESVRLDPRTANRRLALAMARMGVGDVAGAYAAAAAAARLNPFRPAYAAERDALLAILAGRAPEGSSGDGSR